MGNKFFLLFSTILLVAITAASAHTYDHASSFRSSTPCPSKLGFNTSLVPFDTSSLYCVSAWSAQDFVLMYKKSGHGVWSFVLSAPNKGGYVGIGFSDDGKMVGSSAVVGWVPAAGNGGAKQYFLGGELSPQCPPDKGELKLGSTLIFQQSSRLYLAFELNVSDSQLPKNRLIFAVGPPGKLPGADGLLAEHTHESGASIEYVIASEAQSPSPAMSPTKKDNSSARGLAPAYIPAIATSLAILLALVH